GRIVLCSSAVTVFTAPSGGPYSTSKFAVEAYSIVIRHELQPYGVDVIEIVPGCFKTGLFNVQRLKKSIDTVWCRASQEMRDEYEYDYNEKVRTYMTVVQSRILNKNTTRVIDSYHEAVVAKRPKLLYRIGWDVLLAFFLFSWLPVRL
uniref:SDR family NAD(P)-dependent oxidoreductase n=1 Tax=Elaeophora elaphi TaxID=1147741 RepID=A0A0R3RP39_9BILA